MDLTTTYLGLSLPVPVVASASPLAQSASGVRRLADAGVGAIVLPSLFEEQVRHQEMTDLAVAESHEHNFGEALDFFPQSATLAAQASSPYLKQVARATAVSSVPVIASLNGTSGGGWVDAARSLASAGAAAIELNVYLVPGDLTMSGREVEERHLEILRAVKDVVEVPVAVKLSPFFSATGSLAMSLDRAGADGLVLFNRFLQPDVDIHRLTVEPSVTLSHPEEGRLPRTWIAILRGHVRASLAGTTGVETADDIVKYLLAGADVVMTASALLRHGPEHASVLIEGLRAWMSEMGFDTLDKVRGRLAVDSSIDASAYERAGYVAALQRARQTYGDLRE